MIVSCDLTSNYLRSEYFGNQHIFAWGEVICRPIHASYILFSWLSFSGMFMVQDTASFQSSFTVVADNFEHVLVEYINPLDLNMEPCAGQ